MAESFLRQSPLAHLHLEARARARADEAGVTMCERPVRGQLALRGSPSSRKLKAAVKKTVGVDLPTDPGTVSGPRGGSAVLWLGPDEWLLLVPDGREGKVVAGLEAELEGTHFLVSDVSSSRIAIGLSGPRAREVLAKGCSLDLHPRVFGPGRCASSALARCHVLVHQVDDTPGYDVHVHRSFADYAWRWLEDAAREYGVDVVST